MGTSFVSYREKLKNNLRATNPRRVINIKFVKKGPTRSCPANKPWMNSENCVKHNPTPYEKELVEVEPVNGVTRTPLSCQGRKLNPIPIILKGRQRRVVT